MSRNYLMHKINHEYGIALELLSQGYLSIGFGDIQNVYDSAVSEEREQYDAICNKYNWCKTLYRNQIWNFLTRKVGDYIVVPGKDGDFMICEVSGKPIKVSDFDNSLLKDNDYMLSMREGVLYSADRAIDFGFLLPVKTVRDWLPRKDYADAKLKARMKYQSTNILCDDIANSIEDAVSARAPRSLYDNIHNNISSSFLETLRKDLDPDKLEQLVRWFMEKQGFYAEKLPKNESGKKDFADADVQAINEVLKIIIHIQVKFHENISGDWAVEQIMKYTEQKGLQEGYTYVPWVISTADSFSAEAISKASDNNIRLINASEFMKLLIDTGISNIDEAFK